LVNSLLTAIVKADGDALVMHVGEQPYVVAASGRVQLSTRPLTPDTVAGMLAQLLPADRRRELDELGATEHELPPSASADGERFSVVAARGGDDIWIEIRRHRSWPQDAPAPVPPSPEPSQPVIVPLARSPIRTETPSRPAPPPRIAGVDRLLRLAAARGATALHLSSGARPLVRVDGQIAALEGEPVLTAQEVESLLVDLAPEHEREALRRGEGTEWILDLADVGRFRCHAFRDDRGPGGTVRLITTRPASADHLGLPKDIQALGAESQGLVLVAGPRSSGKSTLAAALVDLINRTRADHVITIESQITSVHESRGCLISQREVRGASDEVAAAVRAAIRENPDVLVIEDLRSPAVVELALEATERGHLVIATVSAQTTTAAIGRMLKWFRSDRREQVQAMLSDGLRAAVSQVLVRKAGGGRIAAREVLLNTPAIASLIGEGRLSQIPPALESGRKHGMVPLNDALAGFVQSGVVDVQDAYRQAFDRPGFLAVLRREGVDTSFAERRA
jgi:twitching motility protein PilT